MKLCQLLKKKTCPKSLIYLLYMKLDLIYMFVCVCVCVCVCVHLFLVFCDMMSIW